MNSKIPGCFLIVFVFKILFKSNALLDNIFFYLATVLTSLIYEWSMGLVELFINRLFVVLFSAGHLSKGSVLGSPQAMTEPSGKVANDVLPSLEGGATLQRMG